MAPLTLYHFAASGPSRLVLQVIRVLGLEVDVKILTLDKKGQFNKDFVKINAGHAVPVLVDDDFVLSESRAIVVYLLEKYGPGNSLYPSDVKTKALINQYCNLMLEHYYQRLRVIFFPPLYSGEAKIEDVDRQKLFEGIDFLNKFLDGQKYVAGTEDPTIADISLFSSLANLYACGLDFGKYPNVNAWFEQCKAIKGSEENFEGAKEWFDIVKTISEDKL